MPSRELVSRDLHRGTGGDYEVQLKGGTRVKVSRSRREALERWLGVSR